MAVKSVYQYLSIDMAGRLAYESPYVKWKCQRLVIISLWLCVFLNLMESMYASNSVQEANVLRIDLVHIDSLLPPNITSTERLKRAIQRGQERFERLQITSSDSHELLGYNELDYVSSTVSSGTGEFLMQLAIGTPALASSLILDTGSDLIWTQCQPCTYCYPQSSTIYDPGVSSTYSVMPCKSNLCQGYQYSCDSNYDCAYKYVYANKALSQGIVSYETFTLNSRKLNEIAFGCGHRNAGPLLQGAGLVGFGRGPFSLPSQLAPSFGNVFSYCLTAYNKPSSQTSPLFIGNVTLFNDQTASSTPLIRNSKYPTFYYVSLLTITVATQLFEIPAGTLDIKSDGTGGMIIDTGTLSTFLPQAAYDFVKTELKGQVGLPLANGSKLGLDLCFKQQGSPTVKFPLITFHFQGADFKLFPSNYMVTTSSQPDIVCLGMLPGKGTNPIYIFGNLQQQNYQILYDNVNDVLSFAPTVCDEA